MIVELIKKNRTYRRFHQDAEINDEMMRGFIDLARISSSGGNLQPLKYIISNKPEKNELIFQDLKWANYLKDWNGPEDGEKPSAYIIMLGDKDISKNYFWDHGIACQNILLAASEKGFGGCMFGAVDRENLTRKFNIPEQYEILLVIALGKPKEIVLLEELGEDGDIKYWRDDEGVHHVPKRRLEDILLDL